jgi:hypothetical protein
MGKVIFKYTFSTLRNSKKILRYNLFWRFTMLRVQFIGKVVFLLFLLVILVQPAVYADDSGLVGMLASRLGVSQDQAEGGAGSIFKLAKQNLSDQDYSNLTSKIPGIDKMIGASPEPEEKSDLFGSISSMFGSSSSKLDNMADLKSSFQKLGLSGDMVGKFMPIIYNYVKEKGGEKLMGSLKEALL